MRTWARSAQSTVGRGKRLNLNLQSSSRPSLRSSLSLNSQFSSSAAPSSSPSCSPITASNPAIATSCFPGACTAFTEKLTFRHEDDKFKCFALLASDGTLRDPNYKIPFDNDTLRKMYTHMLRLKVMDEVFYDAQRQGRVSFYMSNSGEEATHIGSASALSMDDWIFSQYREAGVFMWRGYELNDFASQLFATQHDHGKGRQLGVHYGSRALKMVTISSPLATQLPQATGLAYSLKRDKSGNICVCYFGDGAASEGDFHPALNFAATLNCPVLFFCKNNGYAISTPVRDQYAGDGIAARGPGYGINTIRCDGNDFLAVYEATRAAKKMILETGAPVLIEAMTYRISHHSTSDDSSRYRDLNEITFWIQERHPITRARRLLENLGIWTEEEEKKTLEQARSDVLTALLAAEQAKRPPVSEMWTDVYADLPEFLAKQKSELDAHLEKNPEFYNLSQFAKDEEFKPRSRS